jgi:hypothetical protein
MHPCNFSLEVQVYTSTVALHFTAIFYLSRSLIWSNCVVLMAITVSAGRLNRELVLRPVKPWDHLDNILIKFPRKRTKEAKKWKIKPGKDFYGGNRGGGLNRPDGKVFNGAEVSWCRWE